jgi:hypothetical protein
MTEVVRETLDRDSSVRAAMVPHPHTVTETSRRLLDEDDVLLTSKRRRENRRPPTSSVQTVRPHPLVWKLALERAGGDASRLIIRGLTNVEILNHPRPRNIDVWGRDKNAVGDLSA